nr:thiamine pyrophosphate-binding protein [Corynebacterium xerosis]
MQRYTTETTRPETNTIGHGAPVAVDEAATHASASPAADAGDTNVPAPRTETTLAATVSTAIADVILARADHVFGLVGNANSHVVSHLTSRGFPYTATRHEAGAVAAADAFFRAAAASPWPRPPAAPGSPTPSRRSRRPRPPACPWSTSPAPPPPPARATSI